MLLQNWNKNNPVPSYLHLSDECEDNSTDYDSSTFDLTSQNNFLEVSWISFSVHITLTIWLPWHIQTKMTCMKMLYLERKRERKVDIRADIKVYVEYIAQLCIVYRSKVTFSRFTKNSSMEQLYPAREHVVCLTSDMFTFCQNEVKIWDMAFRYP